MQDDLPSSLCLDFLSRFLNDRDKGVDRSLSDYQAMFPGHEDLVAKEFAALHEVDVEPIADYRPDTIGPFRVLEPLGRGGQATVYLAQDSRLDRQVALKVFSLLSSGTETQFVDRIQREAVLASRLDHPGICRVYEVGQEDSLFYIAMQHVQGTPLNRLIARARGNNQVVEGETGVLADLTQVAVQASGRAHIDRIVRVVEQAANAVHAAHESGIVHRDLKPGNIIITPSGTPVILDFGLARGHVEDSPELTRTGDVLGTPAYAAPEQLDRTKTDIDQRADVWSLGVVLYEMLTLQRPFPSASMPGLYRAIAETDPEPITKWRRDIPADLQAVVGMALRKDRRHRYGTALDFAADLRRFREHKPVLARPPSLRHEFLSWTRRNPVIATAVAAVFLLLLSGLLLTWHFLTEQKELRKVAEERFQEVHQLAQAFALDTHDELIELPGSTRMKESILLRAIGHLERLHTEAPDDLELLHNLINAHIRLGDVRGNFNVGNLGRPQQALVHYSKALQLATRSQVADLERFQARARTCEDRMGDVYLSLSEPETALKYYGMARAGIDTENPTKNDSTMFRFVTNGIHHASAHNKAGRPKEALRWAREMLTFVESNQPGEKLRLAWRNKRQSCYRHVAAYLWGNGERRESLEVSRKAVTLGEELLKEAPTLRHRQSLALSCLSLGTALQLENDPALVEKTLRRGIELFEEYHDADSADAFVASRLVGGYQALGLVHVSEQDYEAARTAFKKAYTTAQQLSDEFEDNERHRMHVIRALQLLADVNALSGRVDESRAQYDSALKAIGRLGPDLRKETRFLTTLAAIYRGLGTLTLKQGNVKAAIPLLELALTSEQSALETVPGTLPIKVNLALTHLHLTQACFRSGLLKAAIASATKGTALCEEMVQAAPKQPGHRCQAATHLSILAELLESQNDNAGAIDALQRADRHFASVKPLPAGFVQQHARVRTRLAALKDGGR